MMETHVLLEVLKSWWIHGKEPSIYYCRDKDGKGIEQLLLADQMIHAVEIKKSATPRREWAQQFPVIDRLEPKTSEGGVVCLCQDRVPLSENFSAIPVGLL